jgi:thiol-disulfide isomerase/thioredoxin
MKLLSLAAATIVTAAIGCTTACAQTPAAPAPGQTATADRPPYRADVGGLARGSLIPDIKVLTPQGKEVALRDRIKGRTLLFLWDAKRGFGPGNLESVERLSKVYRKQGLEVVAVADRSTKEDFDRWLKENKGRYSFPVLRGMGGPLPPPPTKPMDQLTEDEMRAMAEEWQAISGQSVIGQMMNSGEPLPPGRSWGMPGLPVVVAFDAQRKVVGMTTIGTGMRPDDPLKPFAEDTGGFEGLGNLLMLAGVQPQPQDKPQRVFTAQMYEAHEKKVQEERARQRASAVPLLEIGAMAPDFQMLDASGKPIKLSDYRGKVVILDFWATWCGPCIASMPHMQELAVKYKDQGLVVLAAGTDDAATAFEAWIGKNARKNPDIVYAYDPSGREPQRASQSRFGVNALPTQFILDREGRIVGRSMGLSPGGKTAGIEYYLSKAGLNVAPDIVEAGEKLGVASEKTQQQMQGGGATRMQATPPAGATNMQPAQRADGTAGSAPAMSKGSTMVVTDPGSVRMVPQGSAAIPAGSQGATTVRQGTASPPMDEAAMQELIRKGQEQEAADKANAEKLMKQPIDIQFTALDGRTVDVTKMRGKAVIVDFWATWCKPCIAEMPQLKALYDKYHSQGLEIIGVTAESAGLVEDDTPEQTASKLAAARQKVSEVLAQKSVPWPQYFDGKMADNPITRRYAVRAFPTKFLIGADGKLVSSQADMAQLEAQVREILKLPSSAAN